MLRYRPGKGLLLNAVLLLLLLLLLNSFRHDSGKAL